MEQDYETQSESEETVIGQEETQSESEETIVGQDGDSVDLGPSIEDLQHRCEFLLAELKAFSEHLRKLGRENSVELRGPSGAVEAELKALKKLAKGDGGDEVQAKRKHILRSSNIPYHEAVWTTAKRSSGVIAFNKRFFWQPPKRAPDRDDIKLKKKQSALVDIVAQDGAQWIKVSTITETRLLFELAKQGWESADETSGSEEDDESLEPPRTLEDDEDDRVSILRMAQDIAKAAKATRVRYRHPTIHFILPKIVPGRLKEIDKLLDSIRTTGATVEAPVSIDVTTPPLHDVLASLTVDNFASFSHTLNIDCTILLALVSDLSHAQIECKPWFHRATTRQIEMEEKETLLPSSLYPAMGAHPLVCTHEAAQRMREIVDTIGTSTERERTAILMGDAGEDGVVFSRAQLVEKFAATSEYTVPQDWQLPIRIVGADEGVEKLDTLPALAQKVSQRLSDINRSVFLYGWRAGLTTITSNRTVAKMIEETIEANRDEEDDDVVGPAVWLCPMARSLVGKEKHRKRSDGPESGRER